MSEPKVKRSHGYDPPPGGLPVLGVDFEVGPDALHGIMPGLCSYCGLRVELHPGGVSHVKEETEAEG